jgi:hypothetical protein
MSIPILSFKLLKIKCWYKNTPDICKALQ